MAGVVIAGAGQAGYQCAESLRHLGYDGAITLIGEEAYPPYQRPPLSKAYLLGDSDKERLKFRTEAYYGEHDITLRLGTRVSAIDRAAHAVELSGGEAVPYSALVLATGARVRPLPVPGADLDGVCFLKTIDDVDRIEARLGVAETVAVVGAGFIGLEFAAVASKLGKRVTVLEAAERVMARVVSPPLSEFFTALHESHGVAVRCGVGVVGLEGAVGAVRAVTLADGTSVPADLVVVGIGVIPNTDLAEKAGLDCAGGIVVDGHGRTSDPAIYAAGDCAVYAHPFAGRPVRLESVQNAADQGRAVAASVAGLDEPYVAVPWFWSDQYDVKLQMAGLADGCDRWVARGAIADGKFSLFHFRGAELRAIDSVNKPADHIQGRKLLAAGVSPTPEQAADPSFALKGLLS